LTAFRTAVEALDLDAVIAQLAPEIVLHSPVTFKPFEGESGTILHFRTRVGDREVEGIDLIHTREDGLIDDFTVMVRPLSAALALRDAIGARLGAQPQP